MYCYKNISRLCNLRSSVTFLLLFVSLTSMAQKNKYKFFYRFSLSDSVTESVIKPEITNTSEEMPVIKGKVVDENGNPISYASVLFIGADSNKNNGMPADINGNFSRQLKPGSYKLMVSSVNCQTASHVVTLRNYTQATIDAKLGYQPETTIYNVKAAKELTTEELGTIKECLKKNRNNTFPCIKKGKYLISIEI